MSSDFLSLLVLLLVPSLKTLLVSFCHLSCFFVFLLFYFFFWPFSSASAPSSLRAHSVRGVATSWAFARNASLSSILAAASWSSSSVFTSFYLSDVQFSSSLGFSLDPVVAAGSVV